MTLLIVWKQNSAFKLYAFIYMILFVYSVRIYTHLFHLDYLLLHTFKYSSIGSLGCGYDTMIKECSMLNLNRNFCMKVNKMMHLSCEFSQLAP